MRFGVVRGKFIGPAAAASRLIVEQLHHAVAHVAHRQGIKRFRPTALQQGLDHAHTLARQLELQPHRPAGLIKLAHPVVAHRHRQHPQKITAKLKHLTVRASPLAPTLESRRGIIADDIA